MFDGGEDTLDRIRRSQMNPVLGREVIDGEQFLTIFPQALSRLRVLALDV